MKKLFKWSAAASAALFVALLIGLLWAHIDIRSLAPELPPIQAVLVPSEAVLVPGASLTSTSDLPVRLRYINTASQEVPRSAVLESSVDPDTQRKYVMSQVAFVLEWGDGRIFLIDTGMPRAEAIAFGEPGELLGAKATQAHGGVTEQLGASVERVAGLAFTHLHDDHTAGITNLCEKLYALSVFQGPGQFERSNYLTRASRELIESAPCATPRRLEGGPLLPIPGFPGLFIIEAAGHTPGSQLFVVHLAPASEGPAETWLLTGDVVNHIDGVRKNLPKPYLYSTLLVPESPERLDEVRRYLQTLESDHGVRLLVSHDQLQLESSGIEAW